MTGRQLARSAVSCSLLGAVAVTVGSADLQADPPRPPTELVVNGGFEAEAIPEGTWRVMRSITGWQTSAGPGIEVQRGAAGRPHGGAQLVELDSNAPSAMRQEIDTAPEHEYLLSYWVSPRPGIGAANNRLEVRWEGKVVDRYVASSSTRTTTWVRRELRVTASRWGSMLEFADVSAADSLGAYVDDVSVIAVR